ncbi:HAD family hydrolase [Pseudactinotalea suaedae]|uniref:HAD family hydrolase n=1 Tax=Pseudactinotalea suaedae TaxID=1524924 RepID=UPI0012E2DCC4|nr:HAD family phosphatase [Pseudactinotalea suaedae]
MTSETSLTTVVLDLGNVLIGWDPRRIWSRTLSEEEIETFLTESGFVELNHAMDGGRTYADARAEMSARAPHHVTTLDAYWHAFPEALIGPVPGTAELVSELADLGIRLLGLTNWSAETIHHAPAAAPAIAMLEDLLVSGHEGLAKPDPAIFELLIERYDLVPEQTLFVDDVAANVEAARSVGLHAHLFTGAEGLRGELRSHGVEVAMAPAGVEPS